MKPLLSCIVGAFTALSPVAHADTILWYNGDLDSVGGGTVNENTSNTGAPNVYDDFNVTAPNGWLVNRIWSDNSMSFTGVSQAAWSIRSGLSVGNPGTIISSGIATATQTQTGRSNSGFGTTEYAIEVAGLNVYLAPGTYWLSVSPLVGNDPISNGYFLSYVSLTLGVNRVGTPAGNNANSFLDWPFSGDNFSAAFDDDYSMGVAGTVVPEPSIGALALLGMLVAWRASGRSD